MGNARVDSELFRQLAEKYSLIRLNGKTPVEKDWQQFCHSKRTYDEIGFRPGENAGIACGPASDILVLDVDIPDLFEKTCQDRNWNVGLTLCHETGSGKFHFIYKYPQDYICNNRVFRALGFDIRGVNGQVVAPGSIHPETGGMYSISIDVPLMYPPQWILNLYSDEPMNGNGKERIDPCSFLAGVPEGERDHKIFRYACRMREKGFAIDEAKILVLEMAKNCSPRFSERVALKKVDYVWNKYEAGEATPEWEDGNNGQQRVSTLNEVQQGKQEGNNEGNNSENSGNNVETTWSNKGVAAILETYIANFSGTFSTKDIDEYVRSKTGVEKLPRQYQVARAKILNRHVDAKRLERTVRGGYHIVDTTLEDLDEGLGDAEHHIKLPLELASMVYVEPKEVILVGGNTNAGKTCFALTVGLLNKTHTYKEEEKGQGGYGIYHFLSEMGGRSFRTKMDFISPTAYNEYRKIVRVLVFKPDSIQDQIQPNSINIIDYLEPAKGDFREIVPTINAIFEKLVTGVAVICVQTRGEGFVGGEGVLWKPRLAVALMNEEKRGCQAIRIVKGKNSKSGYTLKGWQADYWVKNRGTQFDMLSDWQAPHEAGKKTYRMI